MSLGRGDTTLYWTETLQYAKICGRTNIIYLNISSSVRQLPSPQSDVHLLVASQYLNIISTQSLHRRLSRYCNYGIFCAAIVH